MAKKSGKGSLEVLHQQLAAEEKLLAMYEKTAKSKEGAFLKAQQEANVLGKQVEILQKKAKLSGNVSKQSLQQIKNLERQKEEAELVAKQIEATHVSLEQSVKAAQDLATALSPAGIWASEYANNTLLSTSHFLKLTDAVKGGIPAMTAFVKTFATDTILGFIDAVIGLAFAADEMESKFRKTTGASASFAREVTGVYESTRLAGVSMQEASGAATALFNSYTDFTMISPKARGEIAKTVAVLGEFGVSNAAAAGAIQNMTKAMGLSGVDASKAATGMVTYAQSIGVAPQKMMADFKAAGGSLAKFGKDGVRVFKDLQRVSKITGIEVGRLLDITGKFDTFEGAAKQAGMLNAAIGGNMVNAMDLMMETDPVERFKMIRNSIMDAGMSFDSMSYYQKKFYTQQLGLKDEAELAAALSGDLDSLGMGVQKTEEDYRKMREEAAAMQSVQDQLKNLFLDMIPVFMPLIDAMRSFVGWLRQNPALLKRIATIALVVVGVMVAWKVATILATVAMAAFNAVKFIAVGLWKLLTFWQSEETKTTEESVVAMGEAITAAGSFAIKAIALGAAISGVALSLGQMAIGFAELIRSVSGLDSDEMEFINDIIMKLGIGLGIITVAFIAFGAIGGKLTPAIGAVAVMGAAFVAAGFAVKIMAEGISTIVDSFTRLFEVINPEYLGAHTESLTSFAVPLGTIAGDGFLAAAAAGAMALAFGLLGLALRFLGPTIPLLAQFTDSVWWLIDGATRLDEVATAVSQLKAELSGFGTTDATKLAGILGAALITGGVAGGGEEEEVEEEGEYAGYSEDFPMLVKEINPATTQTVKIVMDAEETRRFLSEGVLDTIGEVVREAIEGAM